MPDGLGPQGQSGGTRAQQTNKLKDLISTRRRRGWDVLGGGWWLTGARQRVQLRRDPDEGTDGSEVLSAVLG